MTSQKSPRSTEVVRPENFIIAQGMVRRLIGKSWRIDFRLFVFFCFFLLCDVKLLFLRKKKNIGFRSWSLR